jgi:transcription-repair coupling factor (superfamily II helicase)
MRSPAKGKLIAQHAEEGKKVVVVSASNDGSSRSLDSLEADIRFFAPHLPVYQFYPWDTLLYEGVSPLKALSGSRLLALDFLLSNKPGIVLTTTRAILQKVLPLHYVLASQLKLLVGMVFSREGCERRLGECGYQQVSLVESIGQCAIRGSVIDFFSPEYETPIRIEWIDDIIDEIRVFDSSTQRSLHAVGEVRIFPLLEWIPSLGSENEGTLRAEMIARVKHLGKEQEVPAREIARTIASLRTRSLFPGVELTYLAAVAPLESFWSSVPRNAKVVCNNWLAIEREAEVVNEEAQERFATSQGQLVVPPPCDFLHTVAEVEELLHDRDAIYLDSLLADALGSYHGRAAPLTSLSVTLKARLGTGTALEPLRAFLNDRRKKGVSIAFVVGSSQRAMRLHALLLEIDVDAPFVHLTPSEWLERCKWQPVVILLGTLSEGCELTGENVIFVAEGDIFNDRSRRTGVKRAPSLKRLMTSLAQLDENNYVVHQEYGIAIYRGLKHMVVEGVGNDFLQLEFADTVLYLPIFHIKKVQKFVAAEGVAPVIDRVSSLRWKRTKEKVKQAVVVLAGELIRIYAHRKANHGWRFEPPNGEDEEFADTFSFDETPDQAQAIEQTLHDMASELPMDRLICGDVGFGKTEVAIRAAFKCVQHARQVAVLVPTTILAEQHLESFRRRFMGYSTVIEGISRFYTTSQVKETVERLKSGEIDIIIGTHKLLSSDVVFKDLGLLIIDEEHRFGVKQKEKLKAFKAKVDILTLTATPIPRTLNMALLGIRDVSVIATPPTERKAIRTFVAERSTVIIRDAISRELQRGGQIFYVINRIEALAPIATGLQELAPSARIVCAHGQMKESILEDIMTRFVSGEIDILVTTTIVESGIDVPRANTIIIDNAHLFGMAQLYQLRGRVGRAQSQAYAYLLLPRLKSVSEEAQQRLMALQSLDDLGVGFQLAMRDLEIRGAGNLLGKEQSGNVAAVGYELYSKILEEAVSSLQGKSIEESEIIEPEIKVNTDAFLPSSYLPDLAERLILYQRLSGTGTEAEICELREEIDDRYGPLPPQVENLIRLMSFRTFLHRFRIRKVEVQRERALLSLSPSSPISFERLQRALSLRGDSLRFTKNLTLSVALSGGSATLDEVDYKVRLFLEEIEEVKVEAIGAVSQSTPFLEKRP